MPWLDDVLARLSGAATWGYLPDGPTAAEPAALAALALIAHDRAGAATAPLEWLRQQQSPDGGSGVMSGEPDPAWPTGWAVLAWNAARHAADLPAIERGTAWLLASSGKPLPRNEGLGHDTTLIGWPWVETTHSWVEPTAMAVLALKAVGLSNHPRTREGVRVLIDRLLDAGGCNYGNTMVLDQTLRPHMQPTGLCLWALAGEDDHDGRIARAIDYLRREIPRQLATASLCYAVLGLAAHDVRLPQTDDLLERAAQRTLARSPVAYRLALLALAAPHAACVQLPVTMPANTSTNTPAMSAP